MSRPLERFADARVLIIDDNLDNLDLMAAVLGRAGLRHVRTESQVLETTALLASSEPDLIVLDLHMPHVDGFAVLREVMAFAAGSYLPVLVVSADISRDALHRALAGGARDFVTKPFDTVELLLRVRNLLETRFLHVTVREHMLTSKNGELRQPVSQLDQAGYQRVLDRIRQALGPAGFQIALQPIVDTNTSQPVGFEALSRFSGPPEQPPDEWFAAAAEVGLGTDLEVAAVRRALSYLPEVQSRHSGAFLAVNASPSTVLSGRLDEVIPTHLCPQLVLELTEHIPVEDYEAVLTALATLRGHGMRLAVDDTGAGYAGFRHLLSLQPEIIKLDISLTRSVDTLASHRALASALAVFAAAVGAQLLAEGVESVSEMETLRELGLSWMQGYYFGRPSVGLDAVAGC